MRAAASADTVLLDQVLVRVAQAVASAAVVADECQAYVGVLLETVGPREVDHHQLQQLDLLSQTLHDLTRIIARTAAHASPESSVNPAHLVEGVGLQSLVNAIGGGSVAAATAPAGDLDLF